jgi:hypothetical protein
MKTKDKEDNLNASNLPKNRGSDTTAVLDAIMDHVALEHAESAEVFTPSEDRWARQLRQEVDRSLAALRRQLTPAQPKYKRLPPVPDELLALEREALIARLTSLRQASNVRYAHQDLTGLTCDDLRQMIVAISGPPHEE